MLASGPLFLAAAQLSGATAAPPPPAEPAAGTVPESCAHPLDDPIVAASPLARADLASFIEVNRRVAEGRIADDIPTSADYLEMLAGLAARDEALARAYVAACEAVEVPPLRYLQTERRVRQVAELLTLDARRTEHLAELALLDDARRRPAFELVRAHREQILHADREALAHRIDLLEGLLSGDEASLTELSEQIAALGKRAEELDRKLAKQIARRAQIEALASRHGIDPKSTGRALDKLEQKIEGYRDRIPELVGRQSELEERYRRLVAADLPPVADAERALSRAREELDALDRRIADPEGLDRELATLELELAGRDTQLREDLEAIEVRLAQGDLVQAARDREAVLELMPELRGVHRLLPALAERLAGEHP